MKPNYHLSDMIRQDLESIAESLTERDGKDHKEALFHHYEIGCWNFVNAYIDEFDLLNPVQSSGDTILQKMGKYLTKGVEWFTGLKIWEIR